MLKVVGFFLVFFFNTTMSFQTTRIDNICSPQNVKRVFLNMGETGVLSAYNVTINRNTFNGNTSLHEKCQLDIVTCSSCAISLTFRHMNLNCFCEPGLNLFLYNPCRCDYVWVTEPPYYDASGISFCTKVSASGKKLKYQSKTRAIRILFVHSNPHFHAFTADFVSERNRQFFFGSLPKVPGHNLSSGIISSPFFPLAYPRDLVAEYVLTCFPQSRQISGINDVNAGSPDINCRIHLVFSDFQLSTASILEFYEDGHRVDIVNGSIFRPQIVTSSTNSLTIRFYAGGENNVGFKAVYSFVSEETVRKMVKPTTDCGGSVENFGGTITMMNMVKNEMKLYDCIWLIRPSRTFFNLKSHLYLKITTFSDFEGNAELQVREGLTSDSPLLETLRYPVSQSFKEHVHPLKSGYYVNLKAYFGPSTYMAITYASFSYNRCFILTEYLCRNHRCISKKLICDGFDHCGDNSDEQDVCYQGLGFSEWNIESTAGPRYMNTPNYYFPKKSRPRSDLSAATVVFLIGLVGLILLTAALAIFVYRIGSKAHHQRSLQDQLRSISELLDELSDEVYVESIVIDDPPCYEPPPNYDDVITTKTLEREDANLTLKGQQRCRNEDEGSPRLLTDEGKLAVNAGRSEINHSSYAVGDNCFPSSLSEEHTQQQQISIVERSCDYFSRTPTVTSKSQLLMIEKNLQNKTAPDIDKNITQSDPTSGFFLKKLFLMESDNDRMLSHRSGNLYLNIQESGGESSFGNN